MIWAHTRGYGKISGSKKIRRIWRDLVRVVRGCAQFYYREGGGGLVLFGIGWGGYRFLV